MVVLAFLKGSKVLSIGGQVKKLSRDDVTSMLSLPQSILDVNYFLFINSQNLNVFRVIGPTGSSKNTVHLSGYVSQIPLASTELYHTLESCMYVAVQRSVSTLFFLLTFVSYCPFPRIPTGYVILDVSSVMLNSLWLDTSLMSHNLRESFCSRASRFASDFAGRELEVDVAVGRSSSTKQYEDKLFFGGTWDVLSCPTIFRTYDS